MTNACDGSDWTPEPGEDVIVRLDPAAHGCDRSLPRDRRSAECNKRSVLRCARQGRGSVTKPLRYLQRLLLGRDQMSDMRMAKVMEPEPLQTEPVDPAVEHLGDRLRIERVTGGVGEDKVVIVRPARADEQPLLGLALPLGPQSGDRRPIDVDGPSPVVGLGTCREDEAAVRCTG